MVQEITIADLDAWLATAEPGEAFTYYTGATLPLHSDVVGAIRELYDQGEVLLVRAPSAPVWDSTRVFYYRAIRSAAPVPPRFTFASREPAIGDEAARARVLRLLKRKANFRQHAPCNADIAAMTGISEIFVRSIINDLVTRRQIGFHVGEGRLRTPFIPSQRAAQLEAAE